MKLIYMWLENYSNRIVNQEFGFSSEFFCHYDLELNELIVKKNEEYIDNFYGNNILDITAIVGENGAGKTTLTKCVYEVCKSVTPVNVKKCGQIIIYKEDGSTNFEDKLIIFYSKNKVEFNIDDITYECVDLCKMSSDNYMEALKMHKMSTVYFTNAFDISHISKNKGLSEYSESGIKKSICFSPTLMLKKEMHYIKNSYGAQSVDFGSILDVIQEYAERMVIEVEDAYTSAFAYNFLLTVRHTPNAIAAILPVLSKFALSIESFGDYTLNFQKFGMMNEYDKSVYFIRKNIYEHIIQNLSRNNWEKIYANILCEIVLFLSVFNGQYINVDFAEIEKNYYHIDTSEAFKTIMNQVEDSKKKDLICRIRSVKDLDLKIFEDFFNYTKEMALPLLETKWYKQVKYFKDLYEKNYQFLRIPDHLDCGYCKLIDILLDEYYNDETFWHRMIKIIPNPMSSGEMALINIFSSIYKLLLNQTEGNILLIIDEIDAFLHPKWQQDILTHIVRWINENEKFKGMKIQIIFASHSPIILSDIPRDRIIYLSKLCKTVQKENLTFGANISKLFYDSFFMETGSIGAFAKHKIQKVINNIKGTEDDLSVQEMMYIINNIGEPFVMQKLQRDLKCKVLLGD